MGFDLITATRRKLSRTYLGSKPVVSDSTRHNSADLKRGKRDEEEGQRGDGAKLGETITNVACQTPLIDILGRVSTSLYARFYSLSVNFVIN